MCKIAITYWGFFFFFFFFFHHKGGQILEQVVQTYGGISILDGVQNPTGHGPEQADLIRPALSRTRWPLQVPPGLNYFIKEVVFCPEWVSCPLLM